MTQRNDLLKQAERAERLADQATDREVIHTLRDAARDYRMEADRSGEIQPQQHASHDMARPSPGN